jgi:type VI protein secretion system component Hcp
MKSQSKKQDAKASTKLKDLSPKASPKGGGTSMQDFHFTKVTDKASPSIGG